MDSDALPGLFADEPRFGELVFSISRPILPATGNLEFYEKNPDGLRLLFYTRREAGVPESQLSADTTNTVAMAIWKKIAKRLKNLTETGAVLLHPTTGEGRLVQRHRFTPGAKAAEANGVPMLTIGGLRMKFNQDDVDKK